MPTPETLEAERRGVEAGICADRVGTPAGYGLYYSRPCGGGTCAPGHLESQLNGGGGIATDVSGEADRFRSLLIRERWLEE